MIDPIYLMIISLILIILARLFLVKKVPEDPFKGEAMTTVVECTKCEKKVQRDFEEGDYIGKALNTCPCGKGVLRITKIFYEKMTEEEQKWLRIVKPWE